VILSTTAVSYDVDPQQVNGTNAYAVLASPRHSGTEAMVISASWISRIGEEDGTINIRGAATVLALANFLKRAFYLSADSRLIKNFLLSRILLLGERYCLCNK
jgi:glycosylphosphatidylinositol transamidase